jgi:hypothetical protein
MTRYTDDEKPTLRSPAEMVAPGCGSASLLTQNPARVLSSPADLAPPPPRPGSQDALQRPSLISGRLHYRDGRCTDLAGKPINTMQQHLP